MRKGRNGPEPVSCQSCRSKKLKCDRSKPCSNCSARGISCNFLVNSPVSTGSSKAVPGNSELRTRFKRTETIERTRSQAALDQSTADKAVLPGVPTPSPTINRADAHRGRDEETHRLENIGTRKDSLLPNVAHSISVEVNVATFFSERREKNPPRNIILAFPGYNIAVELLRSYESTVNHPCPILYVPTIRARLGIFYHGLKQNDSVNPGEVSLFLSIFAIAAFFYVRSAASEAPISVEDAARFPTTFTRAALDALDHSRRVTSGTLEDVQAYIILSMLTFQLDGFSARGRMLLMAAIALAKDLRLHKLDTSRERRPESIRTKIMRLLSAVGGPQEGTYAIHPGHIDTRLPKYCMDDEIAMIDEVYEESEHRPTAMAYFLQRVKLAHVCREVVDSVPTEADAFLQVPYERILALDQKLVDFISNLPVFFKQDADSRNQTEPLQELYPQLALLRYSINQAAHSRRCKLHQRFLLRQSLDPRYSYSRVACIESAHAVIQSDQHVVCPDPPWIATARRGIATHFKHLATMVLVMDLCFNSSESDDVSLRMELKSILEAFEGARYVSPLLGQFLDHLYKLLRLNGVDLGVIVPKTVQIAHTAVEEDHGHSNSYTGYLKTLQTGNESPDPLLGTPFEDSWSRFLQDESNFDPSGWDELFSTLDSQPL